MNRDTSTSTGSSPKPMLPGPFDPAACLAYEPRFHQNSWFLIGYVTTDQGEKLNFLVHQIIRSKPGEPLEIASIFNVTDITARSYRAEERVHRADEVTLASDVLRVTTPSSEISGDIRNLHVRADFGWGAAEFDVSFPGLILLNGGSGVFSFFGEGLTGQYSIPSGRGAGTLTLNGARRRASGNFWFDRQWGFPLNLSGNAAKLPDLAKAKWCWMDLNLSNGIVLGLWEIAMAGQRHGWVTALKPDGTHIIAALEPLFDRCADVWSSPTSSQKYPTRWTVSVPALRCTLEVKSLLDNQEIPSAFDPKYEGVAEVTGVYDGEPVTGFTLIELVGNWRA